MKKSIFTLNVVEKSIVGTKSAIARANKMMEPEYSELCGLLEKHPTFKVAVKKINQKKVKKTYNGLSIERMREYISTQDNKEEKLVEFEAILKVAEAMGAKYPLAKKWFLNTYEEYKVKDAKATDTAKASAQEAMKKKAEEEARKALAELKVDDEDYEEYEEDEEDVA